MAVIHRTPGGVRATAGSVTVLGRAAVPAARADTPRPLDVREQLHLDALDARTRRVWADRLAAEEEALVPEEAAGFAARVGAAFDAESERTLADIDPRLWPHATAGLDAIREEIVAASAEYEDMAARVGDFNMVKGATDDIAALIFHDRSAHDRLLEEGLSQLARAPVSESARALLERRLRTRLAQGHAASHIEDDPGDALGALTAAPGDGTSPYDSLSDEQRVRYAARGETENGRRRSTAQFTERNRLEALIEAGRINRADIETSSLDDEGKRDLVELFDRRNADLTAAAAHDPFNEFGPGWNPSDPLGIDALVAAAMERSLADGANSVSAARKLVRRLGRPVLEAELTVFEWLADKIREYQDPLAALTTAGDLVTGIPWFFASVLGGVGQALSFDFDQGEKPQSAGDFADHLLREFKFGVSNADAARLSIREAGEWLEAKAFNLLERKIDDGTIDRDEAAIYVPLVGAMALFGLVRKRLHAGSGDPQRDVADLADAVERVVETGRLAQIRALIPVYYREMRAASGFGLKLNQMRALRMALKERDFGQPLEREIYAAHNKQWPNKRAMLRKKWETQTGQEWPKRIVTYYSQKRGELVSIIVHADAHHIIPQKNGGPHEWWNIIPVQKGQHQRVIHGRNSTLPEIQRREAIE